MIDVIYNNEVIGQTNNVRINGNIFKENKNIKTVDLSNHEIMYGNMASSFLRCENLTDIININDNVYNLYATFEDCYNLTNISKLPNNVTNMYYTFYNCYNLVNVPVIPDNVISMYATFHNCNNLINITRIPNSAIDLGSTFSGCHKLQNIPEIPNSVTSLSYTFSECYNLINSPIIPNSVTDMSGTFRYCYNLVNSPIIPNSVTSMDRTYFGCYNLVNVPSIPDNVENMDATFIWCSNLVNSPKISNNTTLMNSIFRGCSRLINAPAIPNSVIDMAGAFIGCSSLINAPEIPSNVKTIFEVDNIRTGYEYRYGLFENCYNLTGNIYFHSENIIDATNTFKGTSLTKNVYIPFTYKNSGSETFYRVIVGEEECLVKENVINNTFYTNEIYSLDRRFNMITNISRISYRSNNTHAYYVGVEYRNGESMTYNYALNDYTNTPYIATYNIGDNTLTYNSFIDAGYSTTSRVNGVLLFDIDGGAEDTEL